MSLFEVYSASCVGKVKYKSRHLADKIVKRRRQHEGVYRCRFCGQHHIATSLGLPEPRPKPKVRRDSGGMRGLLYAARMEEMV